MRLNKYYSLIFIGIISSMHLFAQPAYDTTRFYHLMDKARNGDTITLGYLGGSITQGFAASSTNKRWANQVTSWWEEKFPEATVNMINAGIGGTGSDIGVFRAREDLLSKNVDAVYIEFSVNDDVVVNANKTMEGLVRQSLLDTNQPAVMLLLLKQSNGSSAQNMHKPVAEHYEVPYVSFADKIDAAVAADGITLESIYDDGVHPTDVGMTYIANFITNEQDTLLKHLPASGAIKEIPNTIKDALYTDIYEKTFQYTTANIVEHVNTGWSRGSSWEGESVGAQMDFELDGNAFAITYTRHNAINFGRAELWVDEGEKTILDAFWSETWGPAIQFAPIAEGLDDGKHILHVRILEESSTSGNFFRVLKVLKAGNIIQNASPIAVPGEQVKVLTGTNIELDGSSSYDPESDPITAYNWTIVSAPEGSTAEIDNSTNATTGFTPDIEGVYKIGLQVSCDTNHSVIRTRHIRAVESNAPPVANAGNDTTVLLRRYAYPNAENSFDADNDSLSYLWTLIEKPEGSRATARLPNEKICPVRPDEAGDYVVTLVINDSLDNSEPDTMTIHGVNEIGINNELDNKTVSIYPNPAKEFISIYFEEAYSTPVEIKTFSAEGRIVSHVKIKIPNANYTHQLNLSSLEEGMIILQIITNNGTLTKRIIMQ